MFSRLLILLGLSLVVVLAGVACRTQPYDLAELLATDFSVPADLTPARDSGPCVEQPPPQTGDAGCPCGAQGLCRPATGRISAQVSAGGGGGLRVVVMDDNGCNLHDVTNEHPFSPPRWAPDHERLAYATDSGSLHVVRVDPYGNVTCRNQVSTGLKPSALAWASDNSVWLFDPGTPQSTITEWQLGKGRLGQTTLPAIDFDAALSPGPLLIVDKSCGIGCTALQFRPAVASGDLTQLLAKQTTIGPIRISPTGDSAVFELSGLHLLATQAGAVEQTFGQDGDHAPSFALDGQAILYTANNDELHYHLINQPNTPDLVLPSSWKKIYGPEWSPLPAVCGLPPTCF